MTFLKSWAPFENGWTIALVGLALGAFTLAGCDSAGSSSTDGSDVEVGFSSTSSSSPSSAPLAKADAPLMVVANEDTLAIEDIRFIVSEVELEGEADSAEFETEEPALVDFPLNSSNVVSVANGRIPPGVYNEFGFEVEDADFDDDAENDLLSELPDQFSDWPSEASMVVVGSYTPNGGDTRDFTTYLDAEIEVEIEMEGSTFEVGGDNPSRQLTVNLTPSNWFVSDDGNLVDLSADTYQNPGEELPEFEIEFEQESEVEFDDD